MRMRMIASLDGSRWFPMTATNSCHSFAGKKSLVGSYFHSQDFAFGC